MSDRISRGQWLVLAAALLGWMFDGAEQGMFSLVGRSAVKDLLGFADRIPSSEEEATIGRWFGVVTAIFLVGMATGGVLFGWLGDRIGRVRAMTLSVLTYAIFTGLCGVATAAWQVAVLRFISALGMGGEWSLGVALVMEVWPNRSRALMAGLIGAAANVGYLLVGLLGWAVIQALSDVDSSAEVQAWLRRIGLSNDSAATLVSNGGWRLMMISGAAPALLTFLIRLFVPESARWKHEQSQGATSHWATRDLVGILLGAAGPALIIYLWTREFSLVARVAGSVAGLLLATGGYTYPVIRYLQRQGAADGATTTAWRGTVGRMLLAAGLSGTALLGTWASAQWAPTWADKMTNQLPGAKEQTQLWSAVGAIIGTITAALVGGWLGRRVTYCFLCLSSIASLIWLYQFNPEFGPKFLVASFAVGVCTASFYGWLPLYLPELFRTQVRATGQGFGFNFGRIVAAVGALQTGNLMGQFSQDVSILGWTLKGGYPLACTSMSAIYLVGLVLICFAPETKGKPLPE
ncbi:MAG TPA: MFS transporter [Pirellulales bacterium]|nr:MFS transporter [Pirellulales bacterium]